jgi:hypothetical protein
MDLDGFDQISGKFYTVIEMIKVWYFLILSIFTSVVAEL